MTKRNERLFMSVVITDGRGNRILKQKSQPIEKAAARINTVVNKKMNTTLFGSIITSIACFGTLAQHITCMGVV